MSTTVVPWARRGMATKLTLALVIEKTLKEQIPEVEGVVAVD